MAKKKNSMVRDMIGLTAGISVGSMIMGGIQMSDELPCPIKGGISSIVGVRLLSETSKKIKL